MTDLSLQELQRAYAASGSSEALAALLKAKIRASQLTEERVAMAAALGSEAAKLVGLDEPDLSEHHEHGLLVEALETLGASQRTLFACDCAQRVLSAWASEFPGQPWPQEVVASARGWAQGSVNAEELGKASEIAFEGFEAGPENGEASCAAGSAMAAINSAADGERGDDTSSARDAGFAGTDARRAAVDSKAERDWQIECLINYLLGEAT